MSDMAIEERRQASAYARKTAALHREQAAAGKRPTVSLHRAEACEWIAAALERGEHWSVSL